MGPYGSCQGSLESLNRNAVLAQTNLWATCAGAKASNGVFYGQYFCASDWSCHTYGGGTLFPMAHNHEGFNQQITGFTNGSTGALTCPRGGPVSARRVSPKTTFRRASSDAAVVRTFGFGDKQCLSVSDGTAGTGVTCADADLVRARGLVGVLRPGEDHTGDIVRDSGTLYAIAPSAAKRATLRSGDGTARSISSTGGIVAAEIDDADTTLTWAGDSDGRRLP